MKRGLMLKPYQLAIAIIVGWMIFGGTAELMTDSQPAYLHGQPVDLNGLPIAR
jgi:hypothetical protein